MTVHALPHCQRLNAQWETNTYSQHIKKCLLLNNEFFYKRRIIDMSEFLIGSDIKIQLKHSKYDYLALKMSVENHV